MKNKKQMGVLNEDNLKKALVDLSSMRYMRTAWYITFEHVEKLKSKLKKLWWLSTTVRDALKDIKQRNQFSRQKKYVFEQNFLTLKEITAEFLPE